MHETTGCRAVFLDRDGTIARYRAYCCRPEDFYLLPGAGEAIRRLNEAGLFVMVITNQSAIARRWLSWEGLEQIHQKMRQQLAHVGARIDAIYVCPHHPDDGCACRKPGIAMFQQAANDFALSLGSSYVVGDRMLDVRSGRAAGSQTILVRSGHRPEPTHGVEPDYEAQDLSEAVAWILHREGLHTRLGRRPTAARDPSDHAGVR